MARLRSDSADKEEEEEEEEEEEGVGRESWERRFRIFGTTIA